MCDAVLKRLYHMNNINQNEMPSYTAEEYTVANIHKLSFNKNNTKVHVDLFDMT